MTSDPIWDDMVLVGTVARPHGLDGRVVVNPVTDFVEERYKPGAVLWTKTGGRTRALTVTAARIQGGRPVIALEGFTRIEEVETLAGSELRIPENALLPLAPGQYYEHQLVGCAVTTSAQVAVGQVARVEGGAGGSRLIVDGPRGEIQVPLVDAICVNVDVDAKRITIEPPEGLLELNETRAREERHRLGRSNG